MKKFTLFLLFIVASSMAQEKTTGVLNLSANYTATITLNNSTSTVTLNLSGPNDRWFALQFGDFEGGMQTGTDVVYWDNVELVDAVHNGVNFAPSPDTENNWTLISNQNNFPTAGIRSLVYTRPFDTGDSNDYTFNFDDSTIDIAWAKANSSSFTMSYHGALNRDVLIDTTLETLGVDELSLVNTVLFPNPASGSLTIKSTLGLNRVTIYSQIGTLVKSFTFDEENENSFDVSFLESGIYLLLIENKNQKAWKKIQILN